MESRELRISRPTNSQLGALTRGRLQARTGVPADATRSRSTDRSPSRFQADQLAGYRRALDWILSRKGSVTMTAGVIRKLHVYAQGGSTLSGGGDAGEWKKRNNEIIEILPGGDRRVRFVPAAAKDTPWACRRPLPELSGSLRERTRTSCAFGRYLCVRLSMHPPVS
jgi:hypothetical protein